MMAQLTEFLDVRTQITSPMSILESPKRAFTGAFPACACSNTKATREKFECAIRGFLKNWQTRVGTEMRAARAAAASARHRTIEPTGFSAERAARRNQLEVQRTMRCIRALDQRSGVGQARQSLVCGSLQHRPQSAARTAARTVSPTPHPCSRHCCLLQLLSVGALL